MRFRHILSETRAGLRQNLTMTLAVIMTMWVSLSLFGAGLLANQQVELMKGRWYDKIEISIFLCTKDTRGDQCEPGQDATQAQKDAIQAMLQSNPEVADGGVYFETKQEAYAEFQRAYEGSPIRFMTVDQTRSRSGQAEGRAKPRARWLGRRLERRRGAGPASGAGWVFQALNLMQWATACARALLLLASALVGSDPVGHPRPPREIGIMRGRPATSITMPFLLEA
jgi:cell division transport system permease protein